MEEFLKDPLEDTQYETDQARRQSEMGFGDIGSFQFQTAAEPQEFDPGFEYQEQAQNPEVSDPYLEAFDFLGSPTQQAVSPAQQATDLGFGDTFGVPLSGQDPLSNLDLLVSPDNNSDGMFATSQYFSPSSKAANFGGLNSIVEDTLSPTTYHNTFSPDASRHGSVSVLPPSNGSSYYSSYALTSPQALAHENTLETLKSPYSGSYLGSPPQFALAQSMAGAGPQSYTPSAAQIGSTLSPHGFGSSVPTSSAMQPRKNADLLASGKQLTQEEKAKRRREFHNAVERRRRDLIKEKIKALETLVPPSLLTPQMCAIEALLAQPSLNTKEMKELLAAAKGKEAKPNKASILSCSVDYIQHLQYVSERQQLRRMELEQRVLDLQLGSYKPEVSVKSEPSSLLSEFNPDDFFSEDVTNNSSFQ